MNLQFSILPSGRCFSPLYEALWLILKADVIQYLSLKLDSEDSPKRPLRILRLPHPRTGDRLLSSVDGLSHTHTWI